MKVGALPRAPPRKPHLRERWPLVETRKTEEAQRLRAPRCFALLRRTRRNCAAPVSVTCHCTALFARGEAVADRDVKLVVELDSEAHIGLFALGALERRLTELVGRPVDLPPEPIEAPCQRRPHYAVRPWPTRLAGANADKTL